VALIVAATSSPSSGTGSVLSRLSHYSITGEVHKQLDEKAVCYHEAIPNSYLNGKRKEKKPIYVLHTTKHAFVLREGPGDSVSTGPAVTHTHWFS